MSATEVLDQVDMQLHEPPLMGRDTPRERLHQLGALVLQGAASQVRQLHRIGLAGDESPEDRAAADPENVADQPGDFQVGRVKRLLDSRVCWAISRTSCFRVRVRSRTA
jgi:hypothetical protein